MHIKIKFCILVSFVLAQACTQKAEPNKVSVEDFFKSSIKVSFQISPDGNYISYLKPYKNRLNLFVQSVNHKNIIQVTKAVDRNISNYFWVNNNELLYTKDPSSDDNENLYIVQRDGCNSRNLLPNLKGKLKFINSNTKQNNGEVLIALNKRDSSVFDVYRLNIRNKKMHLVSKNPGNITEWYADPSSKIRLAVASDGVNETLLFRTSEKVPFNPVSINNFKTTLDPIGFCKHSKSCIYALSNQNSDKMELVEFNCNTGKEHKKLFSHPDVDVSEAGYSYPKQELQYISYVTWKKERHYLNKDLRNIYQDLLKRLPNTEIRIADKDSSESKFIIRTFTDKTPGAFYLYIPSGKILTKLSDVNPSIKEEQMCEMKPISFTSRDGIIIKGYLTLPKNAKANNLPVVVIPHGGPVSRNIWGFNSEVQFIANRGYAVFQLNYRGSGGYGKKFWIAGFKNWGTHIQNDITDGVRWLINKKIADKNRIAIYGSGFGGFSALYGLCFQPDLYACGISYSGIINLFTYMKDIPPYYKPYQQMYYEMVGNPEKDADYFREVSPVFHADKINAPILIVQGAKDKRANLNEIDQFVKEVKSRGGDIKYILKADEGRHFIKQENRVEFYQNLEKFLDENLR